LFRVPFYSSKHTKSLTREIVRNCHESLL
jgi:hypothetical protein